MNQQPYVQMFDVKQWGDHGLHATVGDNLGRLEGEATSNLLRILDHIHVVDRIFQHHLQGLPHGYRAARSGTLPTFDALAEDTRCIDDWYAAYVRGLSSSDLAQPVDFVFTSGRPARMRRSEILLHVCQHGAYHRGAAGAVLQLNGLSPNRDGVTDFLDQAA